MIQREGTLQTVSGDVPVSPEPADVVDQHVQTRIGASHLGSQTAHLRLDGHVGDKDIHRCVTRRSADTGRGRHSTRLVAAGNADPGAQRGEPGGGSHADAPCASGDQNGLPGHDGDLSHGSFPGSWRVPGNKEDPDA